MTRALLILLLLTATAAAADPLTLLVQPGTVGLLRHANAPGFGDPPGFRLGDCATQRNLAEPGREQARTLGRSLREAGVKARVFASAWCRTQETAVLLDNGPVETLPALNSFFDGRADGPVQTTMIRRFIASWSAGPLLLVTHQVNITALTGIVPADGEMVIVRPGPDGLVVLGRVPPR